MKNITLSVDETVLERVRVYAAKRKTTVNRLVREHLDQLAQSERQQDSARERLLKLIDESPARLGPNWKWNREDAYEGRVFPRHKHSTVRRTGKT
jgi:Family of unknown function (DUF6364)